MSQCFFSIHMFPKYPQFLRTSPLPKMSQFSKKWLYLTKMSQLSKNVTLPRIPTFPQNDNILHWMCESVSHNVWITSWLSQMIKLIRLWEDCRQTDDYRWNNKLFVSLKLSQSSQQKRRVPLRNWKRDSRWRHVIHSNSWISNVHLFEE